MEELSMLPVSLCYRRHHSLLPYPRLVHPDHPHTMP